MNYIPLDACVDHGVYRVNARNLAVGVFRAETRGFIGIREKFGEQYLFTEYHWDSGAPHGTVKPLEKIGDVDSEIILAESLGTLDSQTRRPVKFDRPVADGGRGWFYVDTGESSSAIRPVSIGNKQLFDLLSAYEH
jgi:hypothetical protein